MQTLFGSGKFGVQVFGGELQPSIEKNISYNYLSSFTFVLAKYGQIQLGTKRFGETIKSIPEVAKSIVYQITKPLSITREIIYSFDTLCTEENQIVYDFFSKVSLSRDIVYDYTLVSAFERNIEYAIYTILFLEKDIIYDFSSIVGKDCFIIYNFTGATLKGTVRNIRFDVSTGQLVAIIELERT